MKNVSKFLSLLALLLLSLPQVHSQPGYALHFNGFNEYIEVPHDASLNLTNSFTIAAWVYLSQYTEWASIVTKGYENNYTIHQSGPVGGSDYGHLRFTGASPNLPIFLESNTQIPLNEWHYVAITYDGNNLKFYYDGMPDGGGALPGPLEANDNPLFIGVDFPGDAEYWDGNLDEVRIWNVALKATHIQAAMNGHAAPRANALVGYWRFDEGSGTIVYDRSRHGNDGFIVNDADYISPAAPIGNSSRISAPGSLSLQTYPNPFQDQALIQFQLDNAYAVQLRVYNSQGQIIRTLKNASLPAGEYSLKWNGADDSGNQLGPGVYFYQLQLDNQLAEMKAIVLQR